jgi:hypothetical protein
MKLSKKAKIKLFILLILLNFILRYSIAHHEIFNDSFEMHMLANSLSEFGEARWWVHPLSIIGMYPNSYASAISFILSGISQCTGLELELVIFLYGLVFGLLSMFAGYIVAGEIYGDDFFKFLVAFGFSTSQGILTYSTWTAHARSPFIILLPLFLYALLRSRNHHLRFGLMTVSLLLLLLATHHMVFYLIPVFAACFLVTLVYKLKEHINIIKEIIKKTEKLMPLFIISAFCLMVAYPFITHKFLIVGSRWYNLAVMLNEYPRYIGIFIFLAIGGFAYLVFKPNKRYEEWSLLTMVLFLTIFIFQTMYLKWFIIIFAILLAGVGFMNLNKLYERKKKYAPLIVVILLLSVTFSGYFQFLHYQHNPGSTIERYMEDSTYTTGLWIKENMDGTGICNDRWIGWRIGATSGFPLLTGSSSNDQAYGFVDVSEFELVKRAITEEEFWMSSPYKRVAGSPSDGCWQVIMNTEYDSHRASELIHRFNITHLIENTRTQGRWSSHRGGGFGQSAFLHSIHEYGEKDCIYDSGNTNILEL